ncbi:MAG: alanine racemase [Actinomycetota bacterium]|nr:alanine racemase [Actinomycetota bacterium]
MAEARSRQAWAEVDLDAIGHNTAALAAVAAPAALCAVVKADGYGHGAVPVARVALEAGASWLAVAVVEEGEALRGAGIDAPVLLLAEPPVDAMAAAVAHGLTLTLYTLAGVEAAAGAVTRGRAPTPVHVKVDTGMHRVGAAPEDLVDVARAVDEAPGLRLEGLWTHLAVAEEPAEEAYTVEQLRRFEVARDRLAAAGIHPAILHTSNSAGAVAHEAARYDLVRCGISVYGYSPDPALAAPLGLRPAMSLRARVSLVKELEAGERVSYGLRYRMQRRSDVATVPLGYGDGVRRRLGSLGCEVLIRGRRCPIAGTVTMDQFLVDCGPASGVAPGDEVVLIGRQGNQEITADHWAELLDTISYEIVCGVGPRVPRVYRSGGIETGQRIEQPVLAVGDVEV